MLRAFHLIVLVFAFMFQAVFSFEHSHFQTSHHDEMSMETVQSNVHCENHQDVQSSSNKKQAASDAHDCCHMQCCSIYFSNSLEFKVAYRQENLKFSLVRTLRLNNYHNSIYRPPIA